MLTKDFKDLQRGVKLLVEANCVFQGNYKSGFICCLTGGKVNHEVIEREYGIPLAISHIAKSIFEELPPGDAPNFFAAFPEAIGCDGKDLSRVVWQFLAVELRELLPVSAETQAVVAPVIAGMDLLARGLEWSAHEGRSDALYAADSFVDLAARGGRWDAESVAEHTATRAASCAAFAASYATGNTARGADWSAKNAALAADWIAMSLYTSRRRQCATLLRLIKEAPITQEENS
jgi:hypothetical protein